MNNLEWVCKRFPIMVKRAIAEKFCKHAFSSDEKCGGWDLDCSECMHEWLMSEHVSHPHAHDDLLELTQDIAADELWKYPDDDSREKLEADVRHYFGHPVAECVIGWLDRQAAITERDLEARLVQHKGILDATREANESLRAKNGEMQSLLWETGVELSGIVGKLNMGNAKLALVDQDGEVVS